MFVYLFENKGFVQWIFYFTVANYPTTFAQFVSGW